MQTPPDEFRLPFFKENGFTRKQSPSAANTTGHRTRAYVPSMCLRYSYMIYKCN